MAVERVIKFLAETENPEIKYFTGEMEKKLIDLCREKNASETIIDKIMEFVVKLSSHSFLVKMIISDSEAYYADMIELRNYETKIISSIFKQARNCDLKYGIRIQDDAERIKKSSELISRLTESINLSFVDPDNPDYSGLHKSLDDFLMSNGDLYDALNEWYDESSLVKFFFYYDADSFDEYSKGIYSELRIGDEVNGTKDKLYKGNESQYLEVIDAVLDKGTSKPIDDLIEEGLNRILEDETIVKAITATLDEIGLTNYAKGYVRIVLLSGIEKELRARYKTQYAIMQQKHGNGTELSKEEIEGFVEIVNALRSVEVKIQKEYSSMHTNNLEKQTNCNERINELDEIRVYKSGHGVMLDKEATGPILNPSSID